MAYVCVVLGIDQLSNVISSNVAAKWVTRVRVTQHWIYLRTPGDFSRCFGVDKSVCFLRSHCDIFICFCGDNTGCFVNVLVLLLAVNTN